MRSAHADAFNHDDEADTYDAEVRSEGDPIRAAYHEVLEWVANQAGITSRSRVLELGSGTGNLSIRIPRCGRLICVDLSVRMEAIARSKLHHISNRHFIKVDILEVFDYQIAPVESVISTYTVHHLTDGEKRLLFEKIFDSLVSGGRAVFGDLMVQNKVERDSKIHEYLTKGDAKTARALQEEFFWSIDTATAELSQLGFQIEIKRFSDLSYGIAAKKAPSSRRF